MNDPLRHAFRNVDGMDWTWLDNQLGDSGHGRFWKATFVEIREALAASQPPEPSSSEPVGWLVESSDGTKYIFHGSKRPESITTPVGVTVTTLVPVFTHPTLSPTVSQPVTGEEVEVVELVSQLSALAEDDTGHYPATAKKMAAHAAALLSDYQALKAELEASQASHAAARKNFLTMQGAANELRIRSEAAEARLSAVEGTGVERIMDWLCDDVLPSYGIDGSIARNDPEAAESCREALTTITGGDHADRS